jgi:hypothetical protein
MNANEYARIQFLDITACECYGIVRGEFEQPSWL